MNSINNWTSVERYEGKKEAELVLNRIKQQRSEWKCAIIPHPELRCTWLLKRLKN